VKTFRCRINNTFGPTKPRPRDQVLHCNITLALPSTRGCDVDA
jgi:hypothetical protein